MIPRRCRPWRARAQPNAGGFGSRRQDSLSPSLPLSGGANNRGLATARSSLLATLGASQIERQAPALLSKSKRNPGTEITSSLFALSSRRCLALLQPSSAPVRPRPHSSGRPQCSLLLRPSHPAHNVHPVQYRRIALCLKPGLPASNFPIPPASVLAHLSRALIRFWGDPKTTASPFRSGCEIMAVGLNDAWSRFGAKHSADLGSPMATHLYPIPALLWLVLVVAVVQMRIGHDPVAVRDSQPRCISKARRPTASFGVNPFVLRSTLRLEATRPACIR